MYFTYLAGPFALIVMTAVMFLLVPWRRIQKLLPVAAPFGVILGTATYYILQNMVQAWHFQNADLISFAGVPLFMTLAWVPYAIIYFHLLAQYRTILHVILLILITAAVPAFYHFILELNEMVVFQKWSWVDNFIYAAVVFNTLGLTVFYSSLTGLITTG